MSGKDPAAALKATFNDTLHFYGGSDQVLMQDFSACFLFCLQGHMDELKKSRKAGALLFEDARNAQDLLASASDYIADKLLQEYMGDAADLVRVCQKGTSTMELAQAMVAFGEAPMSREGMSKLQTKLEAMDDFPLHREAQGVF